MYFFVIFVVFFLVKERDRKSERGGREECKVHKSHLITAALKFNLDSSSNLKIYSIRKENVLSQILLLKKLAI